VRIQGAPLRRARARPARRAASTLWALCTQDDPPAVGPGAPPAAPGAWPGALSARLAAAAAELAGAGRDAATGRAQAAPSLARMQTPCCSGCLIRILHKS
jgi:hypothetical protein